MLEALTSKFLFFKLRQAKNSIRNCKGHSILCDVFLCLLWSVHMCNIEDLDYFLPSYYNYRLKTNFTMLPRTLNKNLTNNGHYEFIERKTVVNLCRKKEWTKLLPPKIDSIFLGRKQLSRFDEILSVIWQGSAGVIGYVGFWTSVEWLSLYGSN